MSLRLTWPLPAALAWLAAWAVFAALRSAGVVPPLAVCAAAVIGASLAVAASTPWRRVFVAAGFPLSVLASGAAAGVPAWAWLTPLALLLLVYPLHAWCDAPLFPTPAKALNGLARFAALPEGASVLDGGCGLGAGLIELRREYPRAAFAGVEWSWPLALACRLRCRFARIRRGDLWAVDWSGCDLVYLFQRPESMPRAAEKAARELRPGAWLASLEFELQGFAATAVIDAEGAKRVWLYQAPMRRSAPRGPGATRA